MRKKMSLRLSLLIALFTTLWSCRNDYFPDQRENDYNAFRYTYKRISLEESKHKINLIPELKKINEKLKTHEAHASGKAVKYSNGVSVNTDDVIYIERGPNVHSYTFHITRDNKPENVPLENLVLSLLPDGTYKELLITYDFTSQEKQILMNDGSVDTKGKLNVEELSAGTYNGGGLVNKSDISCQWIEESYFTSCSEGQHFNGEASQSQGGPCKADQPSKMVTVVIHRCKALPASTALGEDGTGGGGGPFGGSGGNNDGTPTIPNLPPRRTPPCKQTKMMLTNPAVKDKIEQLVNKSKTKGEIAFLYKKDDTPSDTIQGGEHNVHLSSYSDYKGIYHNHTPLGIKMLSVGDIIALYKIVLTQMNSQTSNDAFVAFVAYETCNCPPDNYIYHHYILRFNGSMPEVGAIANLSEEDIKTFRDDYNRLEMELKNISEFRNGPKLTADLNAKGLEKLLFDTLKNMNIDPNTLILQKVEENGVVNNVNLNSDGTDTVYLPCP
jgi:hypothetical protein